MAKEKVLDEDGMEVDAIYRDDRNWIPTGSCERYAPRNGAR
jgi:hypothetical protein